MPERTVADLLVACLESEGVEYVFGIPGEENILFIDALSRSNIRFVLTRHEQGASFMAEYYGRLAGKAGVCVATLGPGAINLLLGAADAQTNSTPLVAIAALPGSDRIFKESHQNVDITAMFRPVTRWADTVFVGHSLPEMMRKAFASAQRERPGASFVGIPENVEAEFVGPQAKSIPCSSEDPPVAQQGSIEKVARMLRDARSPVVLAGHGIARMKASAAFHRFIEASNLAVATTFMAKGVISDRHPNSLGVMGFMRHDVENVAFDDADLIISVGYELQEFSPKRINPSGRTAIVHIHRAPPDVDAFYNPDVVLEGDLAPTLEALAAAVDRRPTMAGPARGVRDRHLKEAEAHQKDDSFPLRPQRIVADIRAALDDDDIVLVDTGALKMWMARLYPTYRPDTCVISNGLSTMGFALPGGIGAKLAKPRCKVLATMGDGSFLMNMQEIETSVREKVPLVALVWVDGEYGLIRWKMELELGRSSSVSFGNPRFRALAESFGADGVEIGAAGELLPTLRRALTSGRTTIIACPVDYSENLKLTDSLSAADNASAAGAR